MNSFMYSKIQTLAKGRGKFCQKTYLNKVEWIVLRNQKINRDKVVGFFLLHHRNITQERK